MNLKIYSSFIIRREVKHPKPINFKDWKCSRYVFEEKIASGRPTHLIN